MVYKDDVCMWFKNNEPHRRLELLCGLLNMCLPFELRFISTCVEDLGKRDFHDLREAQYKANNTQEISRLENLLDERTRSKVIVFIALLSSRNHTCSSKLYQVIAQAQHVPKLSKADPYTKKDGQHSKPEPEQGDSQSESDPAEDQQVPGKAGGQQAKSKDPVPPPCDAEYVKEMLLIYTMILHHPAFTFEQKRVIAGLHAAALRLEEQLNCQRQTENELIQVLSQTCSATNEACDSGLSVGTEPDADLVSESSGLLPTKSPHHFLPHLSSTLRSGVSSHTTSQVTDEGCGSQDACSSGSGESSELYNEGGTVPTTYIYNSSIYQQSLVALSNNLLMNPGYQCNHQNGFHYYTFPPVVGAMPAAMAGDRGTPSEGSGSDDGIGPKGPKGPPAAASPLSSAQSSPYASPLQSLSPSRASSPWAKSVANTTSTTTTTTVNFPLTITSSTTTTSKCAILSNHSSPRVSQKFSTTVTAASSIQTSVVNPSVCHPGPTSVPHRGKPPTAGNRPQRSHAKISSSSVIDPGTNTADPNDPPVNHYAATSACSSGGHSTNPSSPRWTSSPSAVSSVSPSVITSSPSVRTISRQNSQSPSPMSGATYTCKSAAASASPSVGKVVNSNINNSTPVVPTTSITSRNTSPVVHEKIFHSSGNNLSRPPASSSTASFSNNANNNCLNYEFWKNEKLNKYYQRLAEYPIDKLKRMTDREFLELGLTKSALSKLRRILTGLETPNQSPNGFISTSSISQSHSQSNYKLLSHASSDTQIKPSISHNNSNDLPVTTDSLNTQPYPVTQSATKPTTSTNQPQLQGLTSHAGTAVAESGNTAVSSPKCMDSQAPSTAASPPTSDAVTLVTIVCVSLNSPVTAAPIDTSPTSTTVTQTSTQTSQCHLGTLPPNQKPSLSQPLLPPSAGILASTPISSTPLTVPKSSGTCIQSNPCSATLPSPAPPPLVPSSKSMSHYMTTPPPNIPFKGPPLSTQHHKAPPIQPGQLRTPPPPLCMPPATSSRDPSTPGATNGMPHNNGSSQVFYTSNNVANVKNAAMVSGPIPAHMPGFNPALGITPAMATSTGSVPPPAYTSTTTVAYTMANNMNVPLYTSSSNMAVPSPTSAGLVPMMQPPGAYPTYLYPLVGGPGGSQTYFPPGSYAAQHPHRPVFFPQMQHMGPMAHMKALPTGHFGSGHRGGSSSSSSSTSSGSMRVSNKVNQRVHGQVKCCTRSSDSSPSSSQYSSPPQTPSPDHTRTTDKRGKVDGADPGESENGLLGSGASEEGTPPPLHPPPRTPPPLHPPPSHVHSSLMPQTPNPVARPRYMPYLPHYMGFPQPGMIRYPGLPLPAQMHVVAPRNPIPLSGDKSSRETTPPAQGSIPPGQQDLQCCPRLSEVNGTPISLAGSNTRNGGSPHTEPSNQEGSLPHAALTSVPSIASGSPAQVPCGPVCSGAPHGSVQYNAPGYGVLMSAHMFPHLPGFIPHSSALSNGFVSPPIPPNIAFSSISNGMNSDFVYGGQYPVLGGNSQGGGGAGNVMGPPSTPGLSLTTGLPYPHYPAPPHTPNPSTGAKKSCYNCGQVGHRGAECKEANIEEMCKRTKDRPV